MFWKRARGFLFYLFSVWCVVSCLWLYRIERSAADPEEPEMEIPSQDISDIEDAEKAYVDSLEDILSNTEKSLRANTEKTLREKQADISRFRERYAVLAMLEEKENQAARKLCPDRMYEKYFRLKEGELARIEGVEDAEQVGCMGNLNSHFTSFAFEIHMDMWVQYSDKGYIVEYDTPGAIVIENPDVDLGYMDARAGMNFEEIQDRAGIGEIQTGFMYTSSYEIYYLEYEADGYVYRYLSHQPDGTDSWLEINQKY